MQVDDQLFGCHGPSQLPKFAAPRKPSLASTRQANRRRSSFNDAIANSQLGCRLAHQIDRARWRPLVCNRPTMGKKYRRIGAPV